jgi:hypothetical protein
LSLDVHVGHPLGMWAMDVKTKHTVSIDHLIAWIDWYEPPTLLDMVGAIQSVIDSPQYHEDLRLLTVDHSLTMKMHEQVPDAVQALVSLMRKFKRCALSVGTDAMFEIARGFSTHFPKEGVVSGAFRDEVAAGVWLLGTA